MDKRRIQQIVKRDLPVMNVYTKQKKLLTLLTNIDLTQGQKDIINMFQEHLDDVFSNKDMFVFSGRAGSGKSMTLSVLIQMCDIYGLKCLTGTFTGKASQVLREKGVDSNTLHSIMYKPIIDEITGKITGWSKNEDIECDVLFVDEYSMLSEKLINDILSYDKITVFLGDNLQLPPVGEESLFLEDKTDIELTEVCRQAEGNPIIKWANYVRDMNFLNVGIKEKSEQGLFATLSSVKHKKIIDKLKMEYTQMICGTNKTRHMLNEEYRKNKGYDKILHVGEKITVLKNDKTNEVFNGQIFEILELLDKPHKDDGGFAVQNVLTDGGDFKVCLNTLTNPNFNYNKFIWESGVSDLDNYDTPIFINYAYCLTTHKLQGSSSESVLIFANDLKFMFHMAKDKEKGKEMYCRAIYTAITRAVKNCVVVI